MGDDPKKLGRSKLDEIMQRPARSPEAGAEEPRDAFEHGRPWDFMLDVRFSNGGRCGFSYAYLTRIDHPSGDELLLQFGTDTVRMVGRRLTSIYEAMLQHRPRFIQEGTMAEEWVKPGDTPHINKITIQTEEPT